MHLLTFPQQPGLRQTIISGVTCSSWGTVTYCLWSMQVQKLRRRSHIAISGNPRGETDRFQFPTSTLDAEKESFATHIEVRLCIHYEAVERLSAHHQLQCLPPSPRPRDNASECAVRNIDSALKRLSCRQGAPRRFNPTLNDKAYHVEWLYNLNSVIVIAAENSIHRRSPLQPSRKRFLEAFLPCIRQPGYAMRRIVTGSVLF
ncbi:hypothetical protein BKA66DRAFT_237350 [Pyrenochaeta sp. MPI-SDFR-AT-0127]|nr:hypothetical protein BKA66DRAFT_237350 [Pyrenochaeta sp. MPI-SDFR-AT-0127]